MAIYAISFTIGSEGNRSERYKSFTERVEQNAVGLTFDETTSFYVLECAKSTSALRNDLYFGSDFHTEWDKLVVINLTLKEYETAGKLVTLNILERLMLTR